LTRLAGAGLAIDMLGAFLLVHLPAGFFLPNGYEFVMLLAASTAALTFTGAGRFSVDALIGGRRRTPAPAQPRELRRAA
jgi:putative oxidoreductase